MIETLRSVASLLLSFGLLLMANGLFGTLPGVRTAVEGFSTIRKLRAYGASLLPGMTRRTGE